MRETTVDQRSRHPDTDERGQSKYKENKVDPILEPGRLNEGCDIGVENVVSEHPCNDNGKDRSNAWG